MGCRPASDQRANFAHRLLLVSPPGPLPGSFPSLIHSANRFSHSRLIFVFPIHQGTSGAWSPDGQKLIFRNDTTLYVAKAYGTSSRKLADLPGPLGRVRLTPPHPLGRPMAKPSP